MNITDVLDSLNDNIHQPTQQSMHNISSPIDSLHFTQGGQVGIVILSNSSSSNADVSNSQFNPQASSSSVSVISSNTSSQTLEDYLPQPSLSEASLVTDRIFSVQQSNQLNYEATSNNIKSSTATTSFQESQNHHLQDTRGMQIDVPPSAYLQSTSKSALIKVPSSSPENENYTSKYIPDTDYAKRTSASPAVEKPALKCTDDYFQDDEFNELTSLRNYESLPRFSSHRQAGAIRTFLYNGSSFSGYQKSKNESYEVNVNIQHVDYDSSYLCGYLCIYHLTKNNPSLTTFFDGEIISRQNPFLTRKWEATEEIDRAHWSKFEGFQKYLNTFNLDSFDYDELEKSDYVFMRWKEQFLVPDHTVKHVEGASYAGFYYICFSKRTSSISGYYFHINSEHFER